MSLGDMFLTVQGQRSGNIKGESKDAKHADSIDLTGWSWGMHAGAAIGGGSTTGKTSLDSLTVTKHADSSSTALMSVMRNNELIKKATITVRKAGTVPIDYMIVTLENARLISYEITSVEGAASVLTERFAFSFQKITVDYYPQDGSGARKGGMSFQTEVSGGL